MRSMPSLIVFLLLVAAAAAFGGLFLPGDWYAALAKPAFNPPDWIFAPVWTLLYVLMAVAVWRVWRTRGMDAAIGLWLAQLAVNASWSWVVFGRHALGWGLVDILLMLALVVATVVMFFRRDRWAGMLMLPYAGWVAFAALLNAALWHLNPGP